MKNEGILRDALEGVSRAGKIHIGDVYREADRKEHGKRGKVLGFVLNRDGLQCAIMHWTETDRLTKVAVKRLSNPALYALEERPGAELSARAS